MVFTNSLTRRFKKLENLRFLNSEMDLREKMLQTLATERTRKELADAARIKDSELIDRLLNAGLNAETFPGLTLAPIAIVAWGSGYVTSAERTAAMQAIFDSKVSGNGPAIAKFKSWLETRPEPKLLSLWADFVKLQGNELRSGTQGTHCDRMIRLANQVALASGGIMGFGAICTGEQSVIDRIHDVFHSVFQSEGDALPQVK